MVFRGEPLEMVTTAPAVSEPPLERGPDERQRGPCVEAERLEELCLADGVERKRMGSATQCADNEIDPAEGIDRTLGEEGHTFLVVHRAGDPDSGKPLGPQRRFGRRDAVRIAAVDDHGGALLREAVSARPADAGIGCRSGDDGDLTGKPLHVHFVVPPAGPSSDQTLSCGSSPAGTPI